MVLRDLSPTVSVIIPTYNRKPTLKRAIDSVLKQSFQDFALWIVDDGSQDGTEDWLFQAYPEALATKKIFYIWQAQRGVSAARNRALYQVSSPWVAFLDSDDEWLPQKLSAQMALAQAPDAPPLIHSDEIWIRNGVRVNPMKKHQKQGGRIFRQCLPLCCISPSTALIRTQFLQELGGFNETFPVCEDYELWLKICSGHSVGYIDQPLIIKYGGHSDQLSRQLKAMDYWRVKALINHLKNPDLSPEEHQELRHTLLYKCEILLKGYIKHNNLQDYQEVLSWRDQANQRASF